MEELEKKYQSIKQEISHCRKCPLWKMRINPVAGEGSLRAKIMLIGEAPGANEDREGRPFLRSSG